MKTILTSNLKYRKFWFWIGFQGIGIGLGIGWVLSWILIPNILWACILLAILSILQVVWTIIELWKSKHNSEKNIRFGFFIDKNKYSYTELICNWILGVWPILVLFFYTPVIIVYYDDLVRFISHDSLIWPIHNWIMYCITGMLLFMIMIIVTKLSQLHKRRSKKLTYKSINKRLEEKIKHSKTGTYDGTFGGTRKKAPKGFN